MREGDDWLVDMSWDFAPAMQLAQGLGARAGMTWPLRLDDPATASTGRRITRLRVDADLRCLPSMTTRTARVSGDARENRIRPCACPPEIWPAAAAAVEGRGAARLADFRRFQLSLVVAHADDHRYASWPARGRPL